MTHNQEQTLSSMLGQDPHCCWFAALLSVPSSSKTWRRQHLFATGRFDYEIYDRCRRLIHNMSEIAFLSNPPIQEDFKTHFLAGLDALEKADTRLSCREEEKEWLFRLIQMGPSPVMVFSYIFFAARAPQTYYTPDQIALALKEDRMVWQTKAASYELPGTIWRSEKYLINELGLRAIRIFLSDAQRTTMSEGKIGSSPDAKKVKSEE